jgi:hypothetical protein
LGLRCRYRGAWPDPGDRCGTRRCGGANPRDRALSASAASARPHVRRIASPTCERSAGTSRGPLKSSSLAPCALLQGPNRSRSGFVAARPSKTMGRSYCCGPSHIPFDTRLYLSGA